MYNFSASSKIFLIGGFFVPEATFRKNTRTNTKTKYMISLTKALEHEQNYWIYYIISMMFKCLYFQFATEISRPPYFSIDNLRMLFVSFCVLIIITAPIVFAFNKNRLIAVFIINLAISILLTSDTNYFRYYYGILTVPVVLQIDVKLASSIQESIMSLFKIKDIFYILDLPILLLWLVKLQKKGIEKVPFSKRSIAFLVSVVLGFTGFISVYNKTEKDALIYSSNYVTKKLGVLYSHYDGLRKYFKENNIENKELSTQERDFIKQHFDNKPETGRSYKGVAKESNLIIIQAEALQQFMVNRKINGVEITPNLNKLINESLYFDNIYYQVAGGNTSDAELLLNTSLYPAKEGAAYVRFDQNEYYSLPEALKSIGYDTYALHGFASKFWNRTEMYETIGFDKFIDDSYYNMDDFAGWEGEALSDASFFRQSLDLIDITNPFYSFFITLSSHYPFTFFEEYNFEVGELEGMFMGNYVKAIMYFDKCLGQFIDELKAKGLFDKSLLVVYGDHSGVPRHLSNELMDFINLDYSDAQWVRLQKVPLIVHYPGLKNGETMSVIGGQIDILPTIANLMDFKAPYALGKDLLNIKNGYAVLRNGTVITDDYIYIAELNEMYSTKDDKHIKFKNYENGIKVLLKQLRVSDLIIEKDALKYINNPSAKEN